MLLRLDRHECFSVFHLQNDKQRKQRHSLKLGKKRRESSKRNYNIISPRVIIKAIIIKHKTHTHTHKQSHTHAGGRNLTRERHTYFLTALSLSTKNEKKRTERK